MRTFIGGIDIFVLPDEQLRDSCISIAKSILEQDEYSLKDFREYDKKDQIRCVVDIGANVGAFTLLSRKLFPNAKILAIEPDPRNLEVLKRNAEGDSLITICPVAAMGDSANPIGHLNRRDNSSGGNYVQEVFQTNGARKPFIDSEPIPVACKSINQLLHEHQVDHIDLLKIDTEGAEVEIFKCLADNGWLPKICWIRFEWHGRESIPRLKEILSPTHEVSIIEEGEWNNLGVAHRK